MDKKTRQKALDEISPEELAKVKAHQASTQGAFEVDKEWLLLAEFGMKFGWEAYVAAKSDQIGFEEMLTLIEASRKLELVQMYNDARVSFIGAISANQKNPGVAFNKLTRDIINKSKVKE